MLLARGQAAIDELSPAGTMGVVLEGTALEVRGRADGTRLIVDVIRAGGLIGGALPSAAPGELTGGQHPIAADPHVVIAAEPTRVMIMDSGRLVEGVSACTVRPRVLDNFVRSVLVREGRLRAHLDLVTRGSLRERRGRYLADERARSLTDTFTIPLSRAQLAEYLHADRAALSRELSRMRADSSHALVEYERSSFRLRQG